LKQEQKSDPGIPDIIETTGAKSYSLSYICHPDLLSDSGSRGFSIEHNGQTVEGFIVKSDSSFFAYRNSCPHTGAPLDWVDHQFLDADGSMIQCAVHDARFFIDTGECSLGPCPGESLEKLDIVVRQDGIFLQHN